MQNATMKVEGSTLTITIDLDQENGRSKSGKTISVASTKGNRPAPPPYDHIKIGLNVYKYPS